MFKSCGIRELEGEVITLFEVKRDPDEIHISCESGKEFLMHHEQDCCESVEIVDICGDICDIIDGKVMSSYASSNQEDLDDLGPYGPESSTWTFYNIQTNKGAINIRWQGTSNGYYSESVDFHQVSEEKQVGKTSEQQSEHVDNLNDLMRMPLRLSINDRKHINIQSWRPVVDGESKLNRVYVEISGYIEFNEEK